MVCSLVCWLSLLPIWSIFAVKAICRLRSFSISSLCWLWACSLASAVILVNVIRLYTFSFAVVVFAWSIEPSD